MTWYINKGDDLLRSRKIAFPFFISFNANPTYDELQIKSELLECAPDKALIHPKEGVVTKNCTLTTDLSKVPKDLFKKKKRSSDGEEYWQLHFKLLVTIQSGPMVFSLEAGGKEYGQVGAEY